MSNVVNMKQAAGDNKDYKGAAEIINEIEEEQAKIDQINEDAKAKKAPHADAMAALKKRAREDCGIEAKALSTILTQRRQTRRMEARIAALEGPAADQFGQLQMAL